MGALRLTLRAELRLLRWSNAATVQVIPGYVGLGGFYAALARLPQVASMSTEVVYELAIPGPGGGPAGQLEAVASPDGTLGSSTDWVRVLAGQRPSGVMIDAAGRAAAAEPGQHTAPARRPEHSQGLAGGMMGATMSTAP
jgi:hypothetical protein